MLCPYFRLPHTASFSKTACATQINVDRSDSYTVDLMLPYQNKNLTAYLSTGLIYTTTHDSRLDGVNLKHPMWYCYSGLDMNLP